MFASENSIESMARIVETSPDYRVLRRLPPFLPRDLPNADLTLIVVDAETTGLDVARDEIIELAMSRVNCTAEGELSRIEGTFCQTREPSRPIPPQVTALTGIRAEDVAGTFIDLDQVADFIRDVDLVVAHNAGFDRPFCEALVPSFATLPWGCSFQQIAWAEPVKRLDALLASQGLFHDGHRGLEDCAAVLHLLACQVEGRSALEHLLINAHRASTRIYADGATFAARFTLKDRNYRWDPSRRAWYRDLSTEDLPDEVSFLRDAIFDADWQPRTATIDAFNRFSGRI